MERSQQATKKKLTKLKNINGAQGFSLPKTKKKLNIAATISLFISLFFFYIISPDKRPHRHIILIIFFFFMFQHFS